MTPKFSEFLKTAKLPNQNRTESSKFINFLLEYDCKAGQILDPMIAEIVSEIEQSEWEAPISENGRYKAPVQRNYIHQEGKEQSEKDKSCHCQA